jgi:hypothetical protein
VGGISPRSMFVAPDLETKNGLIPLRLLEVKNIEGDFVALRYAVVKEKAV